MAGCRTTDGACATAAEEARGRLNHHPASPTAGCNDSIVSTCTCVQGREHAYGIKTVLMARGDAVIPCAEGCPSDEPLVGIVYHICQGWCGHVQRSPLLWFIVDHLLANMLSTTVDAYSTMTYNTSARSLQQRPFLWFGPPTSREAGLLAPACFVWCLVWLVIEPG